MKFLFILVCTAAISFVVGQAYVTSRRPISAYDHYERGGFAQYELRKAQPEDKST